MTGEMGSGKPLGLANLLYRLASSWDPDPPNLHLQSSWYYRLSHGIQQARILKGKGSIYTLCHIFFKRKNLYLKGGTLWNFNLHQDSNAQGVILPCRKKTQVFIWHRKLCLLLSVWVFLYLFDQKVLGVTHTWHKQSCYLRHSLCRQMLPIL
jgi:hypothetical protein